MRGRVLSFPRAMGAGLLFVVSACSNPEGETAGTGPYNLALISIDTLRADHLGCYGYARSTSPNLDELATRSVLFERAHSSSSKTADSHMSMFTSLHPSVHGIRTGSVGPGSQASATLDGGLTTFTAVLQANGYATVGFHGGGNVAASFGFDRGFDRYDPATQAMAERWVEKHAAGGKFFLFYHTYHVHDPYQPRPPYDTLFVDPEYSGKIVHSRAELAELGGTDHWSNYARTYWRLVDENQPADVQRLIDLYDGAIAELDAGLTRLIRLIQARAPRTIIIILSDHGEEFREHGEFNHRQLYQEILHVPLIVHHPDMPPRRISTPVSLIDLAPTVLDLLSLPSSHGQFQGRSFWGEGLREAAIFSEFPKDQLRALSHRGRKVLEEPDDDPTFFNLAADPAERQPLDGSGSELTGLLEQLRTIERENAALHKRLNQRPQSRPPSESTVEKLKALGYVH